MKIDNWFAPYLAAAMAALLPMEGIVFSVEEGKPLESAEGITVSNGNKDVWIKASLPAPKEENGELTIFTVSVHQYGDGSVSATVARHNKTTRPVDWVYSDPIDDPVALRARLSLLRIDYGTFLQNWARLG